MICIDCDIIKKCSCVKCLNFNKCLKIIHNIHDKICCNKPYYNQNGINKPVCYKRRK